MIKLTSIEPGVGALAWPNGFDLSAGSLHEKLREAGKLQHDKKVA